MPTVFFETENRKVEVPVGTSLRKAAHTAGVSVYGSVNKVLNCRGFGLCGTDMVLVKPAENISGITFKEKLQLGDSPKERLACQVTVNGDITVSTAPALAYGEEMLDNVKFLAAAAIFILLFLGSVIYMGSELVGKPLF
jgi:ferredoxin